MQPHQILISPINTEKTVRLQQHNQHVFKVHNNATKIDVLNAIRIFYGVTPLSVQMMRCPGKIRKVGRSRRFTKRKPFKKAIVSLPSGKSLELVSVKKADTSVKVKEVAKDKKAKKEVSASTKDTVDKGSTK